MIDGDAKEMLNIIRDVMLRVNQPENGVGELT